MPNENKRIKSGFKGLDAATNGYKTGAAYLIKANPKNEPLLESFLTEQVKKLGVEQAITTLVVALGEDEVSFAKRFMNNNDIGQVEKIMSASIFVSATRQIMKYDAFLEFLYEQIRIKKYRVIVVDGPIRSMKGFPKDASQLVSDLYGYLESEETTVLIADRKNVIDVQMPTLRLNTDVYGRMQAVMTADRERTIIENLHGLDYDSGGVTVIAAERRRQVIQEGYTPDHDRMHVNGELANAAACYATTQPALRQHMKMKIKDDEEVPVLWPFAARYYKPTPKDRIRQLAKAGAFIAAEIDRLNNYGK